MSENLQTKNIFKKEKSPFFSATFTYLILMVVFVGIRIFASFNLLSFLGDYADLVYSLIIQVGVIFGLSLVLYKGFSRKKVKDIFKEFKFEKISVKAILICFGLGILIIFLNIAFNSIYDLILRIFGYAPASSAISSYTLSAFLIAIFASAVLPAFCEEFANRGMLLSGLKELGLKKAIIISGLIFGLMHLNIGQFGYAFLIGMFFAFVFFATGSIWPSIIIHFMNNAVSEYLTFARVNDLPLGNFYNQIQSLIQGGGYIPTILVIYLVLLTIIFLFAWLTYLLIKETRGKKLMKIGDDLAETLADQPEEYRPSMLKIDIPISALGFSVKQTYFPTLKARIPLYTTMLLGTVITIMTLIWNTL